MLKVKVGFEKFVPIDNIVDFVDGYAYFKETLNVA